jgi:hypothetical protein
MGDYRGGIGLNRHVMVLLTWLTLVGLVMLPLTAQDVPFATNTPIGGGLALATNTPPLGPIFTPAPPQVITTNTPVAHPFSSGPDAPAERYALRRWDEPTFTLALIEQIRLLQPEDLDRALGIRVLQLEFAQRFPGAPKNLAQREQLLRAMLDAPRGSVDPRPVVRPYIEAALNQLRPSFGVENTLEYNGFRIETRPAFLDARVAVDAVVMAFYPANAPTIESVLYEDAALAVIDEQGVYRLPEANLPYPALPVDDVEFLGASLPTDLNGDGLDELSVVFQRTGSANQELAIYGWRGGAPVSLVEPGERILIGERLDTALNSRGTFTVHERRLESAAWGCYSQRPITWTWRLNFFRPPVEAEGFKAQNSLGCLLYAAEPLFEKPVQEAINTLEQTVPLAGPEDQQAAQRAQMTLAMLRLLNNEPDIALDIVSQLSSVATPGSWLEAQVKAFTTIAAESNVTPIQVCATLQAASLYGACDVDQVLMRLFSEQPFIRSEPIEAQAARLGLTILERVTISAVGRLDREAVHFNLSGNDWWAFAPLSPDTYTAEKIPPPPGFEPRDQTPLLVLPAPESAYSALLDDNNPEEVLNILDNLTRRNPNTPLSGAARFLQGISYDLLGHRADARNVYYALWRAEPGTVWGQLAAAHLERR